MNNLIKLLAESFITFIYILLLIFLSQFNIVLNNIYLYVAVLAIAPLSIIFIIEYKNIKHTKKLNCLFCLIKTILYFGVGLVISYIIIYKLIHLICPHYKYCYFESCNYFVKMLCDFGG